ncbi:MAG: serine/threonine-protein kinase [Polyangiaceae bacterium]
MDLKEGHVLAGKYRIEKILGQGGMGVVVAATHLQLGERVALKFLLPEALSNPEAVERFAREARAAVKIKSEHVARVSDVGTLESGAPYMVMEYLEGGDLSAWLQQRGPLPIEQAVEFILQACEAIAEAHALGIVHRDLKPANLFVIHRADGVLAVKVLDFGISKASGIGSSGSMTTTSAIMGSPYYMSPEQMQSTRDVDPRADIWALGVVLYELIAGQYPFQADAMPELVLKIAMAPPLPLSAALPGVPVRLESVILKCLEKDRGKRYPTIGALALALLEFGPRRSKSSVERISGIMQRAGMSATALELPPSSDQTDVRAQSVRAQSATDATQASWGQTAPPPRNRRRAVLAVLASLAVAGLAGGGYALSRTHSALPIPLATTSAALAHPQPPQPPAVDAAKPPPPEVTVQGDPNTVPVVPPVPPSSAAPSPSASEQVASKPPRGKASVPKATPRVAVKASATVAPTVATEKPAPTPSRPTPAPVNPLKMKIE